MNMEIKNIKNLIENKLACLDIENKNNHGEESTSYLHWELTGMKQMLYVMGFSLVIDANPYFHENNKPSTYEISLR
jgi:hypothetical protein